MRQSTLLWLGVAAVLLFGGGVAVEMTRGLRNNNPGNIRKSSNAWQGKVIPGSDPSFEQFETMPLGIRAAAVLFRNYQRYYGLRTIADLISRWAPPTENDTASYIAYVSDRTGIDALAPIDLSTDAIYPFLRAVFRKENGPLAETFITEPELRYGVSLA